MRRLAPIAAVVWAALALAACGSSKKTAETVTTPSTGAGTATTTAPQTTTTTTTTGGIDTMAEASTNPVSVAPANKRTALLTGVRAARHEGYDRIVFEFANELPGYDVGYVQPPVVEEGSGRTVAVKGAYVLRIRMRNALDADLSRPSAPQTYSGPQRFDPGTPEIAELVRTGGFEGALTWVAGLRDRVDFRVTTLHSPARVVVDVRNH